VCFWCYSLFLRIVIKHNINFNVFFFFFDVFFFNLFFFFFFSDHKFMMKNLRKKYLGKLKSVSCDYF